MKAARTRFAPSPTGFLHVGGVRTALFNYLWAKKTGGQFILRLEDTDQERFIPEGVEQIVESLEWLGLIPDEGFWISEGRHQSIGHVQSQRHKNGVYTSFAQKLVDLGLAYYSPTSTERLKELRHEFSQQKLPFIYRKELDKDNSDEEIKSAPIRFDVNAFYDQAKLQGEKNDQYKWTIEWPEPTSRHPMKWMGNLVEDFIIIKSDGFPTYNFANVIDDHDMEVSHVMRGEEFFSSTPKHIMLYEALGFEHPQFVHLPTINGTDGKKLSKRTGDTNVLDYRDKGYLPEALLNFLALLGWNDGSTKEIYIGRELEEKFSLERINTSPAVFDQKRLDWINGVHVRDMPIDHLYIRTLGTKSMDHGFWPKSAEKYDDDYKKQVLAVVRERLKYLAELPELTEFFFTDLPVDPSLISGNKQLKKLSHEELKNLLEQAKAGLHESDFSSEDLTKRLNELLEKTGQKPAILFSLIRVATTQAPASPGLADTLAVLGKARSLTRINKQLDSLA